MTWAVIVLMVVTIFAVLVAVKLDFNMVEKAERTRHQYEALHRSDEKRIERLRLEVRFAREERDNVMKANVSMMKDMKELAVLVDMRRDPNDKASTRPGVIVLDVEGFGESYCIPRYMLNDAVDRVRRWVS